MSLADRHLSHRLAAKYGTGDRLGWQSAIGNGFNKITSYSNPDSEYSFDTEYINSYVGGDAYNYIINGTYFTAYAVMGTGSLIISAISGIASAILSIQYNNEKIENQNPEAQIPIIQDQI